ncbi:methylated-DNA--[protein]-cysteine S-methyltransferase [Oxalobacter aliiformigenes]|uniref:methylated-DNA--[protein]-cysteine S-methyltransferase n=1 Tax=Oxalobacter aliiformigenes TaxID=2946593 RepID=UPI0022AF17B5|nr:methylated-DNA--[protein]-cysteine S-methyltransferase [Oxalobacter aliiformigenes]MCZ4064765.1 methylated-DNA--[protein]-cysteine S-methyltransferase [Oxalobacter aliiformigenes]WAV99992.1 methylated-DNA--[protein]-cysteine S-methyltransferase [Oxalobacter aliiformigenes]
MLCYRIVPFAIGKLTIMEENGKIVRIKLNRPPEPAIHAVEKETSLIAEAVSQLSAYFEGRLKTFDLPLDMSGTPFRMKTWEALKTIPYGETRSYGDIARQIGQPKACRAVGMANHNNPVAIVVPCHRVIGSDGSLTGYGGGLPIKRQLLDLEKRYSS